jgi:hypothetical protein
MQVKKRRVKGRQERKDYKAGEIGIRPTSNPNPKPIYSSSEISPARVIAYKGSVVNSNSSHYPFILNYMLMQNSTYLSLFVLAKNNHFNCFSKFFTDIQNPVG